MDNKELKTWSIEDSECSADGQGNKSINTQLDSLRLSSLDSGKSDDDIVSRGNGVLLKSHPRNRKTQKNETSEFVMNVIETFDSSKSSGYSSDITTNIQVYEKSSISNNVPPIFEEKPLKMTKKLAAGKSMRKMLETILKGRQEKNRSIDSSQWIFDFDDTNLIKCCRRGHLAAVASAIKELIDNHQIGLINHQNAANETALSIATYQMNELIIDVLLQHGAYPNQQLAMKNNVLHIAADLEPDRERKTFGYLLVGIQKYQSDHFWESIHAKNIFKCDPLDILKLHRDAHMNDHLNFHRINRRINEAQHVVNSLYNHFSRI